MLMAAPKQMHAITTSTLVRFTYKYTETRAKQAMPGAIARTRVSA